MTRSRGFHSSRRHQTVKPFLLADIGEGITECEVIQWFVEPGSTVAEFDKICEVQSDKASVEITSRYSGKITKLHHPVNGMARVGEPLVDIDTEDGDMNMPSVDDAKSQASSVSTPSTPTTPSNSRTSGFAMPSAQRLLQIRGLDVSLVKGTGKGGRILKSDVLAHLAQSPEPQAKPQETAAPSSASSSGTSDDSSTPLTMMQKAMIKSMTKSLSIPHLGYKDEIELDATTQYRAALNDYITSRPNEFAFKKMSYLPIFIKCLSIAMSHYPIINATIQGNVEDVNSVRIAYRHAHNIGVAMDTPQGLVVPNIKNVQDKTIFEVAAELHRLMELGKKGAIPLADLKEGTITLSNIGAISGLYANPVVVSSELAIVALGKTRILPRYDSMGNVVSRQILPISWSADHRVIDGATIARFGNTWKSLIENPAILASELR
ncbi:2-oxoacid dehydrogenases acyltransferase-domain-containing protein [Radiomyces spectabilis]|uniref:2-oxoacid dehydrogenases acyltransferase-domain-containing protein n=1 Tax=Radiomyces spectabilis TaxID=64574 RepID=UPI0022204D8C|nr:2-oxoacid dehydrogenases acyltransferase-domain-containing protein [Radiomyces spectabilis]KAI8388655.1 2-oxoacid dehydrogenases acyltransferase-domain-containing protein [Radiomyces spectabilis]